LRSEVVAYESGMNDRKNVHFSPVMRAKRKSVVVAIRREL
jgi:hypothetical protein